MKTKTYNTKKQAKWKIIFGVCFILLGIILEVSGHGDSKIGSFYFSAWAFTVGAISIAIGVKNHFYGGEIKYDERTQMLILKSSRFTFSWLIYLGLTLIVVSAIKPIQVSLMTISSLMLFCVIIVYKLYYWHINKKY